jgi:carboxyl-terminal processing protease
MIHKHSLTWVALFGVIVLMFLQLPPMAAKQDSVIHTYSALVEVDALAKQQFVEPIEDDRLVDGAIRGMMFQLDPYSGYISPNELSAFERRSRGDFSGVGLELGMQSGQLTVIAPVDGSPAAQAGVLAGDTLLSIDGHTLEGRSVFDVEEMLVGPPGTRVHLEVRHPGQHDAQRLSVARGPVHLKTVRGFRRDRSGAWDYMIDREAHTGYIRVSNFRDNTMRDFDAVLTELLDGGARALILDLRFNPGGVMPQAVAMVDRFVNDGLILSTVTRRRAVDEYMAVREGTVENLKLVVLINGSSASAAEIVAGSLQARGRAVVVGERSFGKGSVQHLIHLAGHKAAIKLTVAYYRLPDGRIIHRTDKNALTDLWGVTPDVKVTLSEDEVQAIQESRRKLDVSFSESATSTPAAAGEVVSPSPLLELIRDAQLEAAMSVARAPTLPKSMGSP